MKLLGCKPQNEDPSRLDRFLETTTKLDWSGESTLASLNSVYEALNRLLQHEIVFYYKSRKAKRRVSFWTRSIAILLGTVGILLPILAGASPDEFKQYSPYGYVFLALAAATLGVNRLFGATGGHIRYVTTQLELERLMTCFRLEWSEWLAKNTNSTLDETITAEAFGILRKFTQEAYRAIQEETNLWGKATIEALEEYGRTLATKKPASPDSPEEPEQAKRHESQKVA